ncbi:MAG TPA: sensor histidine kinase [Clostridia bacterium]
MIRFRDMPIRNKLIISFLALIILPAITIGIFSFYTSQRLLKQKTEQYTNDILMETGENVDVKLREIERISFQIVSNMTIQEALKKANMGIKDEYEKIFVERAIDSQLKGFVPLYLDIASAQVISLSGTVYYVNPGSVTIDISDSEKRILEEHKGGAVWFGTNPSSQTIRVGRAINSIVNQELIGYEIIQIRESSVHDIYRRTDLFKSGDILITDLDGRIISHKDKSKLDEFIGDVAAGLTKDSIYNSFTTVGIDGTSNYVASRSINNGQWRMIAIIPTEQYERDIILLRYWILGICGACCIMSLLLSLRISDSISRPLRNLSEMMNKVGKGNFDVSIQPYSNDEVGVLSEHFNKMVQQVQKLIQEVYQEQYLKQKAELKSLRAQINPHFLYNTLESINWMARTRNVPEIGDMVKALGDLMRASISGDDFVTLNDEITNITNYLKIQKFRYGDRLGVCIGISPDIGQIIVPKLILQPIVENSIVHGLEEKLEDGHIKISGKLENGDVVIMICDDGVGMEKEKADHLNRLFSEYHEGTLVSGGSAKVDIRKDIGSKDDMHTHIGLINVDRRIKMYYGAGYGLSISSVLGEGTSVKAVLPARTSAPETGLHNKS